MSRSGIYLCAVLLGLGVALGARAGALDAQGSDLEVSLVTYGPGAIYWERFGHDAIRLRDRVSGESVEFSYGVFDFEDSAFLWHFARGYMRYKIDVQYSDNIQRYYIKEGRSVVEQRLALSAAQAASLRSVLLWNLRPENAAYNYDYLTNNCATRVRDALNLALGGALRAALVMRPAPMTYRQQIDRVMSAQPWMMLAMDFGLGPSADRPLNEWQESFLPIVLERETRSVRIPDGRGGFEPLVVNERQIAANRLPALSTMPPDLDVPLGVAGLALAVTMLVLRSRFPALYVPLAVSYLVFVGVVGTALVALWTLTTHRAAWENANLLVFNPLAFALAGAVWRARHGMGCGRLAQTLASFQLGAVLVAVWLYLFPAVPQQNLPWLLFAIPVWLAIAVSSFFQLAVIVDDAAADDGA